MATSTQTTGWVGWIAFAGFMMILAGMFQGVVGLTALLNDEIIGPNSFLIWDITAWGWVHLAMGALLVMAGMSALAGNMFGRIMGVLLAMISAVANLAFVPSYPVWSIVVIVVDVLIIHALVTHGDEMQAA